MEWLIENWYMIFGIVTVMIFCVAMAVICLGKSREQRL